jgi:hypothetical protein
MTSYRVEMSDGRMFSIDACFFHAGPVSDSPFNNLTFKGERGELLHVVSQGEWVSVRRMEPGECEALRRLEHSR